MMLKRIINYYVSKVKGETYLIDPLVPEGYLLGFLLSRAMMKLRGKIRFLARRNSPFLGYGITIKSKSKIILGKGVSIGNKCYIDALSREGIRLGDNVSIGRDTKIECIGNLRFLGKGLVVENNVGLGTDNFYGCAGGISIGRDTIIGNFVSFHAENHNYSMPDIPIRLQGVSHMGIRIGNNCWIGAKATILDGAMIEEGCIIAAGALVRAGSYEKNGIYGGVPAKLIKYRFGV
jgi:acetyltransferase-like isoleucine patch superfamily enzyme